MSLSLILLINSRGISQVPQATPHRRTGDAIVLDGSNDRILRFMDLNLDGDWNDAGEVVTYYDMVPFFGGAVGSLVPQNIAVGPDGVVYAADGNEDSIVRLQDLDGDGVATSPGEATLFFAASLNPAGFTMPTPIAIRVSDDGAVWIANSNTSTAGTTDSIIRLFDASGDGDALDANEAVEYATFAVGQATAVSVPTNVEIGADGFVYYLDNGTIGKGIYRLHDDVIQNGLCTDPGEVSAFYLPASPSPTPTPIYFGLAADRLGNFWVLDSSYERILRVNDLNGDHFITNGSAEESTFFTVGAASLMWNASAASDGSLYVVDDQAPDRVYRLTDLDLDGDASDPGELETVYDVTVASVAVGSIRSIALLKAPYIQVTPNPIPLGSVATLELEAGAFDVMNVFVSLIPDSFPAPPFGVVGIYVFDPLLFAELLPPFVFDQTGRLSLAAPAPSDPFFLNFTFFLQAIGGPLGRFQLSNTVAVTLS